MALTLTLAVAVAVALALALAVVLVLVLILQGLNYTNDRTKRCRGAKRRVRMCKRNCAAHPATDRYDGNARTLDRSNTRTIRLETKRRNEATMIKIKTSPGHLSPSPSPAPAPVCPASFIILPSDTHGHGDGHKKPSQQALCSPLAPFTPFVPLLLRCFERTNIRAEAAWKPTPLGAGSQSPKPEPDPAVPKIFFFPNNFIKLDTSRDSRARQPNQC